MTNICFCLFYGFSLNLPLQTVDKIYAPNLQHSPQVVAFSLNSHPSFKKEFFPMALQPPLDQDVLIIETSRSHSGTPQSIRLLWVSDQTGAETSNGQHTTITRDRHPCHRRDSNPQSHQASGRRPTPLGSAEGRNTSKGMDSCFCVAYGYNCLSTLITNVVSFPSTNHYFGPDNV